MFTVNETSGSFHKLHGAVYPRVYAFGLATRVYSFQPTNQRFYYSYYGYGCFTVKATPRRTSTNKRTRLSVRLFLRCILCGHAGGPQRVPDFAAQVRHGCLRNHLKPYIAPNLALYNTTLCTCLTPSRAKKEFSNRRLRSTTTNIRLNRLCFT